MDDLKLAREKLSPANLEAGLPGREVVCKELYDFIFERLEKHNYSSLAKSATLAYLPAIQMNKTVFLCGVPGTGKTASVRYVIDRLENVSKAKNSKIHPFKFIYINAQHLTHPNRVYSEILRKITGEKMNPDKSILALDKIFIQPTKSSLRVEKKTKVSRRPDSNKFFVVAIDELDLLYNERSTKVLYNLFDWPTTSDSRLILISIANAMDLAERCRGKLASRMGWDKIVFDSYTSECLKKIIVTRLGRELMNNTFEKAALQLATGRIGRSNGDARRFLDTCCQAIDETIRQNLPKVKAGILNNIGFQNVEINKIKRLECSGPIEILILKSILSEAASIGEDNVRVEDVYQQLLSEMGKIGFLARRSIDAVGLSLALDALAASSIVQMEINKPLLQKKIYIKDSSPSFRDFIRTHTV